MLLSFLPAAAARLGVLSCHCMAHVLDLSNFRGRLLAWYDRQQRTLPWRSKSRSPYRIWVSEIMLQQTRVAVVIPRYREFLKKFPSLRSLAASREADVQAAWSGLGYYRRARSLRAAARIVAKQHHGKVPSDISKLKALPGIGDYTAAAVASIAFGKHEAVVDGNVRRVLTRMVGKSMTPSRYQVVAQKLLSPGRPGDFNQAMMELGATVCLPLPKCDVCPVYDMCVGKGKPESPSRNHRTKKVRSRLALTIRKNSVFLIRRPKSSRIMPLMWELPPAKGRTGEIVLALKHSITNTNYSVEVCQVQTPPRGRSGRWISQNRLANLPLTGLTRKILHRTGNF